MIADETDPGNHGAHAKGLAALTKTDNLASRVFSVPALSGRGGCLADLIRDVDLVWTKYESASALQDFTSLRSESVALYMRLAEWQAFRVTEVMPAVSGRVGRKRGDSDIPVGFWPGAVDSYFDLYVANAWNIFRAAELLLIALIIELSNEPIQEESRNEFIQAADHVVNDMLASIPYHLADNLQAFIAELQTSTEIAERGRTLGGLILMHPLFVASKMPFLAMEKRDYMRRCLLWIGDNMGIGQATLLANVSEIYHQPL